MNDEAMACGDVVHHDMKSCGNSRRRKRSMEESMPKSIWDNIALVLVRTASPLLFSVLRGVVYDSDPSFEDVRSRVCNLYSSSIQ
jgi:hypothetical protein